MRFRLLNLLLAACLSVVGTAHAATSVSGPLTSTATWTAAQGPYTVTADVTVSNGAVLTIEAGVTVYMNPGASLIVGNGALRARGTSAAPIVITSARDVPGQGPAPGDWGRLLFQDNTQDANTLLEWVQIRYGSGVRIESASPTLNNLTIQHHAAAAISLDLNASPVGSGLSAGGNQINGIGVPAGEIVDNVQWRLLGIPYVIAQGEVSVGRGPTITGIAPNTIQQGQSLDAQIGGARLAGADSLRFDAPGLTATVNPGGNDTSIPVRISAAADAPLGIAPFEMRTAAGSVRAEAALNVIAAKPNIVVSGIAPDSLRREESKLFTISGNYLQGAQVVVPGGAGLTLGNLQTTPTSATFTLSASSTAALGTQALGVSNPAAANGSGTVAVTVNRALPKVYVSPSPLAFPPDGNPRQFALRLTEADGIEHTVNLAVGDPSIAGVSASTVLVPAGATQITLGGTGFKLGYTVLSITSPTLAPASVPIYVTNVVGGAQVGPVLSLPVGIERTWEGAALPVGTTVGPALSPPVGVERPLEAAPLPAGTSVGPALSPPVGVERPLEAAPLPAGTSVGPALSPPVGVERPLEAAPLPAGTSVGPFVSPLVGVDGN